jgi:3-oxoacyl-[acyl-carrier protein] reductase
MFDLGGKAAIITGGGAGLGRAYAVALAEAGASVMVVDVDATAADDVVQEIKAAQGVAVAAKVDVTSRQDTERMATLCVENFGRIDVLVTNAGITDPSMIHKMTEEQWDRVVSVNQKGVFNSIQAVLPAMIDRRSGRIINVTSASGLIGDIGQINYAATKGAVTAMTRAAARELARYNITVNAISPVAHTEMTRTVFEDPKFKDLYLSFIPLGHFGEPEEIAPSVVFLASDEASYITGTILRVDGGRAIGV